MCARMKKLTPSSILTYKTRLSSFSMHFMSYTCVLISFEEETEINVPMDALTGGQENWEVGRFTPPSTAALT